MSSKHLFIAILVAIGTIASRRVAAEEPVDYLKQIKPILAERCYACHGALKQEGGLRLDTAKLAIQGGESGPAVKPGDPAASLLLERVSAAVEAERMPAEGEPPLKPEQIALLKSWIVQNAAAPADESPAPDPRNHWAYRPPTCPDVPTVRDTAWPGNPVDAFLASQYESAGVTPLDMADKPTLLRRVYFDLIGFPHPAGRA